MTAGIEVLNSTGQFLIGDGFSNMHLVATGVVSVVTGPLWLRRSVELFVPGVSPMLMFGPMSGAGGIIVLKKTQVTGGWAFTLMSNAPWDVSADVTVTTPYYVFDRDIPSPGDFGLQVFDASGALRFDSSSKFMRIKHVQELPIAVWQEGYGSVDYSVPIPVGKVYAACLAYSPMWREFWDQDTGILARCYQLKVTPSSIYSQGGVIDEAATVTVPEFPYASPVVLIADVTGY